MIRRFLIVLCYLVLSPITLLTLFAAPLISAFMWVVLGGDFDEIIDDVMNFWPSVIRKISNQ